MKTFKEMVLEVVKKIPRGKVLTYKEVARLAGRSRAARGVGNILATNFDPKIPCHRVICSDGRMGDYNRGGIKKKQQILKNEGVKLQ